MNAPRTTKPATPLPWKLHGESSCDTEDHFEFGSVDLNTGDYSGEGYGRDNAAYIVHACNAYPELVASAKIAYTILADIRHQWKGRHTAEGQGALIALRGAIAKAEGRDEQDVQDEYTNAKLGEDK